MSWKGAAAWGASAKGADQWGASAGGKGQQSWGQAAAAPAAQAWGAAPAWGKGAKGAATGTAPTAQVVAPRAKTAEAWGKPAAQQPWGKGAAHAAAAPAAKGGFAAKGAAPAAAAAPTMTLEQAKAKLASLTAALTSVETVTNTTLESAKVAMENEKATPQSLKASMESLEKQQTKLNETQTTITTGCADTRKGGPTVMATANEMSKLLIKCKTLFQTVSLQINRLKPKAARAQQELELKGKEAKDTAAFKLVLSKAKVDVTAADNAVSAVGRQAAPVVAKPPEDGEEKDKKLASIQTAAEAAMKKVDTARTELMEKFKGIMIYAPEAKKTAQVALQELQKKLADCGKACACYKNFTKELPRLIENQKAVTEVTEKLAGHEGAIAKAEGVAKSAKLTKAQVQSIDEGVDPVLKAIGAANSQMQAKLRTADAVTQEKFAKLKTKGEDLKKRIDAINTKIKGPKDVIKSEEAISKAKELLEKAEEGWKVCQDAELPFLTGVEVLPDDVSEAALKECAEGTTATCAAVTAGRSWVQTKLRESKTYEADLATSTGEALNPIMVKIEAINGLVGKFRAETQERKTTALLVDVFDAVKAFEKKVKSADGAGKPLSSSSLEDDAAESINAAIEKSKAALLEANSSLADANKLIVAKQRLPDFRKQGQTLAKVYEGIKVGQAKLQKLQASIRAAEVLVKATAAIDSGEEKVKEAEAEAEKAKKAAPKEGKTFSVANVTALDEAVAAAFKTIRAASAALQPFIQTAPPKAKAALQGLLDKAKAAQAAVEEVKKESKDKREDTLSDHFIKEAEATTKAAEDAANKTEQAEAPFLVGNTLDLKITQETLAKCEEAANEVQTAVAEAKKYAAEKRRLSAAFGVDAAKKVKESFASMDERVKAVSVKLVAFEKESKDRTKDSKMVEAGEKTDHAEADVKKTLEAVVPFEKEGAENMSEADAAAPLKAFTEVAKEASKNITALKAFLGAREREQKGNKEHTETLKKLQERATKASVDVGEKKKVTAPHEQRALGTRLLAEVTEQVGALDAEVKKATAACAPLLEKGGEEFLIGNSVKTVVSALAAHMKEKELSEGAYFKDAQKGVKMNEKAFVKYLTELPEAIGHDELSAFSDERRAAVFKSISADGKRISTEDFKGMFHRKHECMRPVAVTNQLEVDGAETICKLEQGSEVVLHGPLSEADAAGMVRSECIVDGKKGWVTVRQHKAPMFKLSSPFSSFITGMDKAIADAGSTVQKALASLSQKLKQGGEAKDGSRLKEAREEMTKLKEPIAAAEKAMAELRSKSQKAKGEYNSKERSEASAHIEIRNKKEAAPFVDGPKGQLEALEADAKAAEEAAAPVIALSGDELQAFATPASVLAAVEKLATAVTEKSKEVKLAVKEQQTAVVAVTPKTGGTALAQQQLKDMTFKVDEANKKATKALSQVRNKCRTLVDAIFAPAAEGIRKHAQAKKLSPEQLFVSLMKGDKISEAAFCKLIKALEGLSIGSEHAKLLCNKLEADGISKDAFMKYVVLYFKVVKSIAFTDGCDISKCKTLRKAEEGEVVECLEGPTLDEGSQMTRIRAKGTVDDKVTEGWITVSGSKGTTFLDKASKPIKKVEKAAAAEEKTA